MGSLSGLEIGFSFVFGVIFIGFVAEVYYFLYWKRRLNNNNGEIQDESNKKYAPLLSYLFCWKNPNGTLQLEQNSTVSRDRESEMNEQDLELGTSTDSLLKGLGGEESVDLELMRVHNLLGPPRFLFTINEETKEDLESEDAKSRGDGRSRKGSRTRSLSDIVFAPADNTPFLTPLASPSIKSSLLDGYNHRGFSNPLFESFTESDLNKLRSSPPPKFKFLRDAEEKLIRRLVEESERRKGLKDQDSGFKSKGGSLDSQNQLQENVIHSSGPSKVLPLASSPSN